ncbi:MAG: sigma-70 family RNA polymerase sigma factor, partial [Spartobacteria bacterium]|nr:sigma-70 family RNA polymerase sigma factor [Spartobacteria bacterium]
PIGDDNGELGEIIPDANAVSPYDELNDSQLQTEVEGLLDQLSEREREILRYRYGLNETRVETLEEVGLRFNITRERVRQIQSTAVAKLRELMEFNEQLNLPDD